MIAVAGELQIREYTDNNNQKRTVAEVIVDEVNFAGDKPKTNDAPSRPSDTSNYQDITDDEDIPF